MSINLKNYTPEQQAEIKQFLKAERKAGREEALEKMAWGNLQKEARQAALEEAIAIIEEYKWNHQNDAVHRDALADRIRQLKGDK